jgi:hypothetical protein
VGVGGTTTAFSSACHTSQKLAKSMLEREMLCWTYAGGMLILCYGYAGAAEVKQRIKRPQGA